MKKNSADEAPAGIPTGPGSRAVRMVIASLKVFFLWVPAGIAALLVVVLVAVWLYLTPQRVENLIRTGFKSMSYGDISLRVKSFSPYSGFEIENIIIRNGDEFARSKFVEIERLVLRYGFFSLFIGNIHFDEIGIYRPRIYIEERKGVWNAERLMKPGKPVKEPEKEEPSMTAEGPPSKELRLPVSVEFLFKFILDDLRLYVKGGTFRSSVEGLSLGVDIYVPPFKRLPKSPEAVSILERMKIELNPKEEMDVTFNSRDAGLSPPLVLTWKLIFEKNHAARPSFSSAFKFGTYKTPVRFRQSHLAPLNFMLSYDMFYNPQGDHLAINHLGLRFLGRKWLFLTGSVSDVTKTPRVDIRMTESSIVLDDLYPYYVSITGDRSTRFRGAISLFPLAVRGTPPALDIDGEINIRAMYFRNPAAEASLPSAKLSYRVEKRADDMKIVAKLGLPHFSYALGRDASGDNGFELGVDVSALNNFQRIKLHRLYVRYYNPADGLNAIDAAMSGDIKLKPVMAGRIAVTRLRFLKGPLATMLPEKIAKSLESVPLHKPLDVTLAADFSLGSDETRAAAAMMLKVPDFDLTDLKLGADVVQNNVKKRITLKMLHAGSASRNLRLDAKGTLDLKSAPFSDSDLRLSLVMDSPEMKPVYGPWRLSGSVKLDTRMTGDMKSGRMRGSMLIKKLFVKNDEAKLAVDDVNMDFPFEYYFTPRYRGESRIRVDKTGLLENRFFREKENFSIRSVRSKHPVRDVSFEYMKNFSAVMFFRENTFEIVSMKAEVLDGALNGRNILFNMADMKPENMEFRMVMDVTNVDINKLDDPDPSRKTRDAELSLNADFSGRGLDIRKELTPQGYINIYRVGDKFANRLLKGLSTEKGKSKLGIGQYAVDNTMNVKAFNFNLDKGLVYATVTFSRKLIGYLLGVEEKVEFDRIPIQEYLRKVQEVK